MHTARWSANTPPQPCPQVTPHSVNLSTESKTLFNIPTGRRGTRCQIIRKCPKEKKKKKERREGERGLRLFEYTFKTRYYHFLNVGAAVDCAGRGGSS